ncbi:unnamed protein product [Rotaria magnacalcarata]|uniref:C3H1-type domain-containing protein n=2 Tax=Rotaria magnacalcarata TaxID=392030 RepID=A0A816LVP3_9BILA|nr:unnamed protein product [Rotaria magnacalcarata]CAF4031545.1 unnamed protein product [Rotaria magnacalcarata]
MNSIDDHISENLSTFFLEPGSSLAKAIGEQILSTDSNETIQSTPSMIRSIDSYNDSEKQIFKESENSKYKTELCQNFSNYGLCSYSSRCQFAHGLQELRCRNRHPKYKTELCRNFTSGYCSYGSRCQFLHNSADTKQENVDLTIFPALIYPTIAATIGTYLLVNVLNQSTVAVRKNVQLKSDSSIVT